MAFPIIPVLMAAASIGKGIADDMRAGKQRKEAMRLHNAIPQEDPGVRSLLTEIGQRQKYAEFGQGAMLAAKRRMIGDSTNQADVNIAKSAGTSPGAAQQGILRNRRSAAGALAMAGAESENLGIGLLSMKAPLVQDIADRKLSMQTYARDLNSFEAATRQQNANNLIMGGMGVLSRLEPSFGNGPKSIDGGDIGSSAPKMDNGMTSFASPMATPAQRAFSLGGLPENAGFGLSGGSPVKSGMTVNYK
jgi:hypothetical protein